MNLFISKQRWALFQVLNNKNVNKNNLTNNEFNNWLSKNITNHQINLKNKCKNNK